MGWFDEQILQRKLSDQQIMEDSLRHIAAAVLGNEQAGRWNPARGSAKAAIWKAAVPASWWAPRAKWCWKRA